MIKFTVEDREGAFREVEVPEGINLNLMEVLKASEYPVLGTCGGMALCASCHCSIESGIENLHDPLDSELDMLDTLPVVYPNSRLACQIPVDEKLLNAKVKLRETE